MINAVIRRIGDMMQGFENLSDCHLHCHFSSDSEASPESMIDNAVRLGLSHICFTDHNDYDYPKEDGKTVFLLDLDAYLEKISVLKKIYKDKIDVRIGVEQGLQPNLCEQINNYDPAHRLDFIIGSTHLVDGSDPYYPSFWEHHSPKESICTYFENIYKSICCCDNFDVYGHLDYVVRYAPKKDADYQPADYTDLLDMILKKLIENGKGIEINTAGLRYGLKEANPCCFILKRYRELGGEILTTGSDAHKPQDMAFAFDIIVDLLKDCGFSYYTLFHQRKPEFIRL